MSATGRGAVRCEADFYPTPGWCVRRLLEACALPAGHWLEPAVGDGAIVRAVDSVRSDIEWWTCDVREVPDLREEDRRISNHYQTDFSDTHVAVGLFGSKVVAITNPPYSLAQEFIEGCLAIADYTVMLLRLNYLGSEKRGEWLRANPPDVYVLPNHPSFVNGRTDACEYAWFVWGPDCGRRPATIRILASTPKAERCGR